MAGRARSRARAGATAQPTRRSISAPTIAGCWSRGLGRRLPGHRCLLAHRPAGRGVGVSGRLCEAAIERTLEALRVCARQDRAARRRARPPDRHRGLPPRRQRRGVPRPRARRAPASSSRSSTAETEARPGGRGLRVADRSAGRDRVMLFDIGGGSTELVLARPGRAPTRCGRPRRTRIRAWTSLPVGVVTLAERLGGHRGRRTRAVRGHGRARSPALLADFARPGARPAAVAAATSTCSAPPAP